MMEALGIIIAFCAVCGLVAGVTRFFHPTRRELELKIEKLGADMEAKIEKLQSKESCNHFHETQNVRNGSFIHQLDEIKKDMSTQMSTMNEQITGIRSDIAQTTNKILEALINSGKK